MFDTALIESGGHHGDHSTVRKLPFAMGFHAAVIGALVSSALLSTSEPPDPVLPIAFPSFGGPPPPPPEGGPEPVRAVLDAKPNPTRADAPPTRMPEEIPEATHDPAAGTSDVEIEGSSDHTGEPGGQENGVPGGVPFSTATDGGPGREPGDDAILDPGVDGVTIPALVERIQPVYPETARKLRQEGAVILEAIITSSGAVDEVRVVASRGLLLDEAAMEAVRKWRYRPATLNGRAVAVRLTVTVRFGLNG